jgi:hypothetical protein
MPSDQISRFQDQISRLQSQGNTGPDNVGYAPGRDVIWVTSKLIRAENIAVPDLVRYTLAKF